MDIEDLLIGMEKQHNKIMPFTHIGEEYTGYSLPVKHPEFKTTALPLAVYSLGDNLTPLRNTSRKLTL